MKTHAAEFHNLEQTTIAKILELFSTAHQELRRIKVPLDIHILAPLLRLFTILFVGQDSTVESYNLLTFVPPKKIATCYI